MASKDQAPEVFAGLKAMLKKFEKRCDLHTDQADNYYLNSRVLDQKKRPVCFGAASVRKGYVSYYLMPVYMFPELLDGMSAELKKRMQGKSCFNFKTVDAELFKELGGLTKAGFERFRKEKLI